MANVPENIGMILSRNKSAGEASAIKKENQAPRTKAENPKPTGKDGLKDKDKLKQWFGA